MNSAIPCCACCKPVVDDLHRDEDGDLWHRECFDDHAHELEMAPLDAAADQEFRHGAAMDRQLRRRPGRDDSTDGDVGE